MWRNYLTVGVRSLAKNRAYAAINILGLAIGMAACLMILLFVRYEFSYDKWLPGVDNVYQLQSWYKSRETGEEDKLQMTPYIAGKRLAKDFPQIEREVYAFSTEPVMIRNGEATTLEDFIFTDGNLLEVLQLPLLKGDRNALSQVGSAVITRSEAIKRLGTDDVVGRTLSVISRGKTRDLKITGVLADLPKNSHIEATTIARIDYVAWTSDTPDQLTCWGCQGGWVYVKLRPGTDPEDDRSWPCRPGKSAIFPMRTPETRASMPATSRIGMSSTPRTSTSAPPKAARCGPAMTAGRSSLSQ